MRRRRSVRILVALAVASCAVVELSSSSQGASQNDQAQLVEGGGRTTTSGAKQRPKPAEQPKLPISLDQALYLIRSILMTLNDANRSGNYSVLRDLAAPGVQERFTAADLAQIFSSLRENHVDLSAAAIAPPQLSEAPKLESDSQLHLTGHFSTQPRQINFDLLFQIVGGHWKWLGLSVTAPDAPTSAAMGGGK